MRTVWNDGVPGVIWEGDEHGHNDAFTLARPHISRQPDESQPWMVWVPYTRPEHFDAPPPADLDEWEQIVANANIIVGETFWDTWREAMDFLVQSLREEPQHCPECRSSVRWEPDLGGALLVCNGCAEILHPYELVKHASVGTCTRETHAGLHWFADDCVGWVGI